MNLRFGHKLAPDVVEELIKLPSLQLVVFDSLDEVEQDALLNHEIRHLIAAVRRRSWDVECARWINDLVNSTGDKQ